jgi:hypothetical protein
MEHQLSHDSFFQNPLQFISHLIIQLCTGRTKNVSPNFGMWFHVLCDAGLLQRLPQVCTTILFLLKSVFPCVSACLASQYAQGMELSISGVAQ